MWSVLFTIYIFLIINIANKHLIYFGKLQPNYSNYLIGQHFWYVMIVNHLKNNCIILHKQIKQFNRTITLIF